MKGRGKGTGKDDAKAQGRGKAKAGQGGGVKKGAGKVGGVGDAVATGTKRGERARLGRVGVVEEGEEEVCQEDVGVFE